MNRHRNPDIIRRAHLGLAITGPFSANRRRQTAITNAIPYVVSMAVIIAFGIFLVCLFLH